MSQTQCLMGITWKCGNYQFGLGPVKENGKRSFFT
jgi:hypothetical protein